MADETTLKVLWKDKVEIEPIDLEKFFETIGKPNGAKQIVPYFAPNFNNPYILYNNLYGDHLT